MDFGGGYDDQEAIKAEVQAMVDRMQGKEDVERTDDEEKTIDA